MGVAIDGSKGEFTEFVEDNSVNGIFHISSVSSPDEVNDLVRAHDVLSIPTFVLIQEDGTVETNVGWSESEMVDDLDWLTS